ncbi:P2RX1 [Bugula neritina]|uniref:P2RX1 n=1 Tax=Bugula neritina TaxID=10212 RepID=A0A7J7IWJ3_BUGNE|nr:P2RX1 [Bugula neritina]
MGFIIFKGYQHVDNGAVAVTTSKLKGIAHSNSTDPRVGDRVWDSIDLHVPPQDNGAFFLTTNVIVTKSQTPGTCPSVKGPCEIDSDCAPVETPYHLGNGVTTGICNQTTKTCMIRAWCPTEDDSPPIDGDYARLEHTANFTVLIKNHVYFPYFDVGRSNNLIELVDKAYLSHCRYHPDNHPHCPIFRIGDIVSLSRPTKDQDAVLDNDAYYRSISRRGAVISIRIHWDCDLDYNETECKPYYKFQRLDNYNSNSAPGYNFRYATNYREDGAEKRRLVKAYGIQFILEVEAIARKFSFQQFILNIGSSLALISVASILSDIVLFNLHKNRKFFKTHVSDSVAVNKRPSNNTQSNHSTTSLNGNNGFLKDKGQISTVS